MSINRGTLAFLGPMHVRKFTGFRYVEVVSVSESITTVKTVGPDDDVPTETMDVPFNVIEVRGVPENERRLWPGSYVSHPAAYIRTTGDGVDIWAYRVVSGYTSSDTSATLHIVSSDGPVRLPLTDPYSAIKVDPLNYSLQTGGGVNSTACSPLELLHQQDKTVVACNKTKSGIPAAILSSRAIASDGDAVVPLINPTSLQLVHVRRQHFIDFVTATRSKRPRDLYSDPSASSTNNPVGNPRTHDVERIDSPVRRTAGRPPIRSVTIRMAQNERNESDDLGDTSRDDLGENDVHDATVDNDSDSGANEEDDINAVRHMNRTLSKRRRIDSHIDSDDDFDLADYRQNGLAFQPPPVDRRFHAANVTQVRFLKLYYNRSNSPYTLSFYLLLPSSEGSTRLDLDWDYP